MQRRTYLTGVASIGTVATVGASTGASASADGEDLLVVDDASGDNTGAGGLIHPDAPDFYEGVWDLTRFRLGRSSLRLHFDFEMAVLENPFNLSDGWSHEFFQVYIRDRGADADAPTGDAGLAGALNVEFRKPYHYVLLAHGDGYQAMLTADSEEVVGPANTGLSVDGATVSVSLPLSAVSDPSALELSVLVAPYDGTRDDAGYLRAVEPSAGDYTIGGGDDTTPKVMDMTVPRGTSQSEVLTGDSAALPYIPVDESFAVTTTAATTTEPTTAATTTEPTTVATTTEPTTAATTTEPTTVQTASSDPVTETTEPADGMTIIPAADTAADTTERETTRPSTDDGSGPGFGALSALLGATGGAAYAVRRLLGDDTE